MNISSSISRTLVILVVLFASSGCTTSQLTKIANTEGGDDRYQHFSAGYTGCLPDKNMVEVIKVEPSGYAIWTAECETKIYLCSGVLKSDTGYSLSCAPKSN